MEKLEPNLTGMYKNEYNILNYLFENKFILLMLVLHLVANGFLIPVTAVFVAKWPLYLVGYIVSNVSLYVIVLYYYFKTRKRRLQ